MLFAGIANAGRTVMVLSAISLAGFAALQTVRVKELSTTNQEYYQKIVDLKAAQELTEELRRANALLTNELRNLQSQLKGKTGYDTPLPSGIADILKRVQSTRE